jgi:hypothetical protein
MEKKIKSFTQFFESALSGDSQSYTYSVFIEAAEDYGYPIFVLKESGDLFDVDGNLLDAPDMDDLFEEYMDAEHGPMTGIDGFGDLISAVDDYVGDESEENLERIDSWLNHLGLSGIDPEKLADSYNGDNSYWNETVSKFESNMRIQFDSDYFGEFGKTAWNFLVLSSESLYPELYGDEAIHNSSPCFYDFFRECPFNLCYSNGSDVLYTWTEVGQYKYKFLETGLIKQDLQLPIIDLILKILNNSSADVIAQLSKNFITKQKSSELYKNLIQRLRDEGNTRLISILSGTSVLGKLGLYDTEE